MKRETYEIVCWPDIQFLMEMEGFRDNAYLINDKKGIEEFGSSAYFVKSDWLEKNTKSQNNKFVDLGLSVKWATCNVGADSPEEFGDYHTYDEAEKLDVQVPTIEQWKELKEKCEWEWKGNGYRVTGKNGNSIFLPAAGGRSNSGLFGAISLGFYWSSSLDTRRPYFAWYVLFDSRDVSFRSDLNRYYYNGLSVRPVSE